MSGPGVAREGLARAIHTAICPRLGRPCSGAHALPDADAILAALDALGLTVEPKGLPPADPTPPAPDVREALTAELDAAWRGLEADALASDGPIRDSDVRNAIRRNRGRIEAAAVRRHQEEVE